MIILTGPLTHCCALLKQYQKTHYVDSFLDLEVESAHGVRHYFILLKRKGILTRILQHIL